MIMVDHHTEVIRDRATAEVSTDKVTRIDHQDKVRGTVEDPQDRDRAMTVDPQDRDKVTMIDHQDKDITKVSTIKITEVKEGTKTPMGMNHHTMRRILTQGS